MKKVLVFLSLVAFLFSAPMVMAQTTKPAKKEAPKIKCCVKGECKEMTKAECKKAKGKVLKDCAKCK